VALDAHGKEIAFSDLNKALCSGEFVTYSEEGVNDLAAWIYDEHGRIVCGKHRDLTTGAAARHGDRAIGYMLCVKGREYVWDYEPPEEDHSYAPMTYGSVLGHQEVWDSIERFEPQNAQVAAQEAEKKAARQEWYRRVGWTGRPMPRELM